MNNSNEHKRVSLRQASKKDIAKTTKEVIAENNPRPTPNMIYTNIPSRMNDILDAVNSQMTRFYPPLKTSSELDRKKDIQATFDHVQDVCFDLKYINLFRVHRWSK
jgi:hypothetical protein